MSAGDVPMAMATVTVGQTVPPGPSATPNSPLELDTAKSVTVTFFKIPTNPAIMHYMTSGQAAVSELPVNVQQTAFPFYHWNSKEGGLNQIKWGTATNDERFWSSLVDTGVTLPPAPSSTPPAVNPPSTPAASTTLSSAATSGTALSPTSTNTAVSGPVGKQASGISSGATAGIAVGCLVAGALIAGLIFWFSGRKRRASGARDYEASSTALMPREKGFAANTVSVVSDSPTTSPLSGVLPMPIEDKAITGEISIISNSIKNHVQSYYQMGRVSPRLIDMDDIHAIGSNQLISAGTLSTLLGNSATREIALRFCIAWVVCSRMQPSDEPGAKLLPVEISECYQKITKKHSSPSGKKYLQDLRILANFREAHAPAMFARWRVMTAELTQGLYARDAFNRSDSRNGIIRAAVDALDNVLRPFTDSRMDNGERRQNLEEILKRSALFAFTLFSQPSTWDFNWHREGAFKTGELCIFPSLVQLSGENGQSFSQPRPFSEAVVRRLDEQ
jgi:hypothetical protein